MTPTWFRFTFLPMCPPLKLNEVGVSGAAGAGIHIRLTFSPIAPATGALAPITPNSAASITATANRRGRVSIARILIPLPRSLAGLLPARPQTVIER